MNDFLAFITWDVNWNAIESPITVRYYGILWAISFLVGMYLMKKMMANDNAPDSYTDKIFIYVLIGGVIGARLGHVIFYDPGYYFTAENWTEIPQIWKGGLASHGGTIGVLMANWLYSKRVTHKPFLWSGDKIVVTVALAACLIRVGNLMNSEIIGRESDSEYAMFFKFAAEDEIAGQINRNSEGLMIAKEVDVDYENAVNNICAIKINVESNGSLTQESLESLKNNLMSWHAEDGGYFDPYEDHIKTANSPNLELVQFNGNSGFIQFGVEIIPRIPTQLWEAGSYLLIFVLLFWGYWSKHWYKREGFLFGLFLVLLFGARFIIEFYKENQVEGITDDSFINRGQQLSIPLVLVGLYIIFRAYKKPAVDTKLESIPEKK